MAPDIEALLAPVSEADPAGPDLAYDPQRHEIEQAFDASVSIDTNGQSAPDADIDWRRIVSAIAEQSARTKDIWLAVYLCRAGARWGRLDIVETGARYLIGLIETFWAEAHPRLEDYGVEGRTGACDTLASFSGFTGPLRAILLVEHPRHGRFSGEDVQRFQHGGEAEAGYGAFRAAIEDEAGVARLAGAVEALETIEALFRRVDAALAEHAGVGAGTSFAPVYLALSEIRDAARSFLPVAEQEALADDAGKEGTDAATGERRVSGAVRSREDVARVIDLAIDYYRRNEPHSPVPLLLGRARAWIHRDFMEVLEDIAPNSVGDVRQLLNFRGGQ